MEYGVETYFLVMHKGCVVILKFVVTILYVPMLYFYDKILISEFAYIYLLLGSTLSLP
jgi:hypothetical protein